MQVLRIFFGLGLLVTFMSCGSEKPAKTYAGKVKQELKKGEKNNDLFLGFHFGMDRQAYFDRCFKLNKEKIVQQGGGTDVLLALPNELKSPASLYFSADFYQRKIALMNLRYQYNAWAPWNKGLSGDSLMLDLKRYFLQEYPGNEFFTTLHPELKTGKVECKIDGNRRIILQKSYDEASVIGQISDLTIDRQKMMEEAESPVLIFE